MRISVHRHSRVVKKNHFRKQKREPYNGKVVKLTVVVKGIKVGQRVDFAEGLLLIDHFPAPTKYRTHKRKVTTITPPQFSFLSELTLNDAFFLQSSP